MNKKKGLGRGLDALLGASNKITTTQVGTESTNVLPIGVLQAGKYQPRQKMDEAPLKELANSIRERGIMQPLLVRALVGSGRFEIIAGERRFRAAGLVGLKEVPVRIVEVDDQAAAAMALIENMQREDLNPLEESRGLARLIEEFGFTHEQAAKAVGKSRSAVSNLLRLSQLAKTVQAMLLAGEIDMGHARALLSLPGSSQVALAQKIVAQGLSVREAEKLAASAALLSGDLAKKKAPKTGPGAANLPNQDLKRLAQNMADIVGLEVDFKNKGKGGELRFYFSHFDELDSLLKKLGIETT